MNELFISFDSFKIAEFHIVVKLVLCYVSGAVLQRILNAFLSNCLLKRLGFIAFEGIDQDVCIYESPVWG